MRSTSDGDTETCHKYTITCYSLLQKIVQSRYNKLNVALGVHLQVHNYKKKTALKALKTHQNRLWNWLIRIKYLMPLIKFYENFMIFYDRVKFYATLILCRVRPMRVPSGALTPKHCLRPTLL